MAEQQPSRNPSASPDLAEIRTKASKQRRPEWLRAWWPAIGWAVVIFVMSTDAFSAQHTAPVFESILRWLRPGLTKAQFVFLHHLIRKSAHFAEYFVFCLLLYRAVRGAQRGWRWTWAITAFFFAAAYSVLDEVHQAFVASRGASPYDSLLDSSAAFVALAMLWLWFRTRRKPNESATV